MNDFRPRLPLNPFNDGYNPWRLNKQCLVLDPTPYIVLFIGDPLQADILPLLHSPRLSHSLILIATHTPPSLPLIRTGPSVCILRLAQPLAVHDSGALRLASLLDRAQRIAAAHPNSSSPRLIQLAEDGHNGPFTILEPYVAAEHPSSSSHVSSPFSSPHEPSPAPSIASEASSSQAFFRSHSPSKRRHAKPSKKINITRRPFDAIINCLPSGLVEKALLKHAILVTTLTAPFLITPPSFDDHNTRSSSSFFRSTPDLEAHMPTSANVSAHIVHVLPRGFSLTSTSTSTQGASAAFGSSSSAGSSRPNIPLPPKNPLRQPSAKEKQNEVKPKLVQSIEQFLLAFGYPLHSISSAPEDRKGKKKIVDGDARPGIRHATSFGDQQAKREIPVPYLVAAGLLGYVLRLDGAGTQASLGEALLLGALDPVDDFGGGGKAWIGNGGEVLVEGDDSADDSDAQVVLTLPPPVRTKSSRRKPERRRMMSDHDKEVGIGVNGLPTPPESAEGSSRSNSSVESGFTSPSDEDEAEVQQRRLGRSTSGRRGGSGGGVKERWARVGRRSSKTRRSAHGQHAPNAPSQFQGRASGLGLPGVPGRSKERDGDDSSEALHKRKPSLKKRNALGALLNSQGLGHLKFWSRREVECVK